MEVTYEEMQLLKIVLEGYESHGSDQGKEVLGQPYGSAIKLIQLWRARKVRPEAFKLMSKSIAPPGIEDPELPGTEDLKDPLGKIPKGMPALSVVRQEIARLGLPESDADMIYNSWLGNGFRTKSGPIKDWRAVVRVWHGYNSFPSQKKQHFQKRDPEQERAERLRRARDGR